MAKIVKTLTVSWQWSGDKYSLRGFNLAVTPAAKNPKEEVVATAFVETKEIKQTYSYKMGNVTLDKDAQYKIWVQAVYENSDSDWVATGGATVSDDGSATIITKTDREIQDIVNMASDNILTRQEKISLRREWQEIVYEFLEIESTAVAQGIPSSNTVFSNFKSKGNALGTYLNGGTAWTISSNNKTSFPLWINDSNLGNNTSINGNTYRETFRVYYEAKVKILEEINKYKVNSVQVGGVNLLVGTATAKNTNVNVPTSFATFDPYTTHNKQTLEQLGFKAGDKVTIGFDWSISKNGTNDYVYGNFRVEFKGIKSDGTDNQYLGVIKNPAGAFSSSNTKGRVEATVALDSATIKAHSLRFRIDNSVLNFKVSNLKMERGTKATGWSPALEEMENAYTVILTNEAQVIPTNSNRVPTSSTTYFTDIQVYKGTTQRNDYTIGTINSANGITVSKTSSRVNFAVSTNTTLAADGGNFIIPITIDGKTFNKTFSWSCSKQGNTGASGVGISKITEYYAVSSSNTTEPTSWSTTVPAMTATNKYLWNYETITYSNNTTANTSKRVIGVYGDKGNTGATGATGATGNGISNIVNYYLATSSSSGVTTGTSGWTTSVQAVSASKKYLWNYEVVTYTNGSTSTTTPCIIGAYGDTGATGATGPAGQSAQHVVVTGEQVFKYANNFSGTPTPANITLTATKINTTATGKWQWLNGSTWTDWSNNASTLNATTLSVSPTSGSLNTGKSIRIRYIVGSVYDEITLIKVSDGAKGENGEAGKDAYTVVLTNETHTFPTQNNGNIPTALSTTTQVVAYKGASSVTPTIGNLPSVSGLTLSKSGTTVTVQANTGTSLADSGSFNIPVTVDGKSFTKTFSWSKAKQGNTGATGNAGQDAITIILSNENHTFPCESNGNIPTALSTTCAVTAYKGGTSATPTIGAITNPAGMSITKNGATLTIQANTGTSLADSGTVNIPITVDGKTFNKTFTWSKAKKGATGATGPQGAQGNKGDKGDTGQSAKYVIVNGEQVFKYTNNFSGTPTPATITLTATKFNTSESGKWQYKDSSGTWIDWLSGGSVVTATTVQVHPTSGILGNAKQMSIRYIIGSVYDEITIVKVSDGSQGPQGIQGTQGATGQNADSVGVISKNYDVVTGNGHSELYIRGKKVANSSVTGHTVFKINKTTLAVEQTTKYTTYGNESACTEMANYLNGLSNCIVAIISSDACRVTDALRTAISKIGGSKTGTWGGSRYSHYVIGMPGLASGQGYEEYKTGASATLSCTVPVSLGVGILTNGAQGIQGNKGDKGDTGATGPQGSAGKDAYTVILTNESHTFPAENNGSIASDITVTTDVLSYKGASSITPTIGTLPTVNGLTLSKTNNRVTIVAKSGTALADSGSFNIPITVDGKSFTKTFSWAKSRKGNTGATGATGAGAKTADIIASSQVFKSTDGGLTFSPTTITMTPKLQNVTYSNWQYSTNGGSNWNGFSNSISGWSVSGGVLTINKDCSLFTKAVTSVVFRLNTNDSSVYDTITIVKLYDVTEINIGGRNYIKDYQFKRNDVWKRNRTSESFIDTAKGYGYLTASTANPWLYQIVPFDVFKQGQKVTIQYEIKCEGVSKNTATDSMIIRTQLTGYENDSGGFIKDVCILGQHENETGSLTNWTKKTITGTIGDIGAAKSIWFRLYARNFTGKIYFRNVKLELGNKATDLSPAPEDMDFVAQDAVNAQTQTSIFNKLTNNGATQGIYLDNGKIYINGEYIKANSITADRLSISDFTNYAQLNNNTAAKYGFTKQADEVGGAWLKRNSMARDIFISDYYTCNGGESFRIKYDISTTIKGNSSNGGTDSTYRGTAIGLYCYDGSGKSVGIVYSTRYTNQTVNGSSSTVKIPTTARKFRVFIQTESYGNWSGELKVRNIQAIKMAGGELIVDGAITADRITSGTFRGTNFEAGGSGNNGQVLVKNTNNAITFIADKNGTKAKEIQFLENPNGGNNNINTILRKDGVSISYSDPSNEPGNEFYNSTQYNFYGLTMSRSAQNTNYTINATSEINTFGSSYRRHATGREEGMSGAVMFGLAGQGKQSGSYVAPAIIYDDTYRNGFTIATSNDQSLKTFNSDTWSGTGTVLRIDSDGITSVRGLNIMEGSKSLTFENQRGGGQMNSLINCRSLQNATGNGQMMTAHANRIYVGNPNTPLTIESGSNPILIVGGAERYIYHTGNKPTPSDIGAVASSDCPTSADNICRTWRYPNGMQISIVKVYGTWNVNTAWGSVYSSPWISGQSFNIAFSEAPKVTINAYNDNGTAMMVCQCSAPTTTATGACYLWKPTSQTGIKTWIEYIAIGRWK